MMAALLVDRQSDTIALLRSRGASRGQVFGAFMTQSIVLSLIALLLGPLLAIAAVYFITERLLSPAAQDAINIISNAPLLALLDIKWYAVGAAIVVIVTMAFSLYRASRFDVWLSTQSDPASLTNVRTVLNTPGLRLVNLYDRRLLIAQMGSDPLYLSLMIILTIGSLTALLLALVGNLLASWMSVRIRLTSFAVLRALGTTPGQITRVLLWEQVVIYSTALLLGIIFGAIISATAVSTLAFSSISASGVLSSLSSDEFYVFQRIIPAQIVIPLSLGLAFAALVVICVTALGIMVGVTLRPSMSQTLRLNED